MCKPVCKAIEDERQYTVLSAIPILACRVLCATFRSSYYRVTITDFCPQFLFLRTQDQPFPVKTTRLFSNLNRFKYGFQKHILLRYTRQDVLYL